MMCRWVALFAVGLAVWVAVPAMANYYDNFDDGTDHEDPAAQDLDDPCWIMYEAMGTYWYHEVEDGALRLVVDDTFTGLVGFLAAYVDYGDYDPNTSETWWDDTTSHYFLTRVQDFPREDPNDDRGQSILLLHGNADQWTALFLTYEFGDDRPWNGAWFAIQALSGTDAHRMFETSVRGGNPNHYPGKEVDPLYDPNAPNFWPGPCPGYDPGDPNTWCYDPNDYDPNALAWQDPRDPNWIYYDPNMLDPNNMWANPGYMNEPEGFWLCFQFEADPNYEAVDPNGKYLWASCWNGDKFDGLDANVGWPGWTIGGHLGSPETFHDDANDFWPGWYFTAGFSGMAAQGTSQRGFPADMKYDNVEARTGLFNGVARTLTVKLKDCCDLNLDPNLPHPDGGEKRRFTEGTTLVLDTVVPCGNKVFKKWTVKGPNDSGDPLYQVVTDTNEVLYLTMDGDYLVKATCKCGGGGIEPFAGVILLVLGLGVAIRRLA